MIHFGVISDFVLIIWDDIQQLWMTSLEFKLSVHFLQLDSSFLSQIHHFLWPRYLRTRITKIHILAGVVQAIDLSCKKRCLSGPAQLVGGFFPMLRIWKTTWMRMPSTKIPIPKIQCFDSWTTVSYYASGLHFWHFWSFLSFFAGWSCKFLSRNPL